MARVRLFYFDTTKFVKKRFFSTYYL